MIRSISTIRLCAVVAPLLLLAPSAGVAQSAADRSIDQYTCKQVMREGPTARETSIAFLHGYLLGKSNSVQFNVETLLKRTDNFINSCLDNPTAKAIDVMMKVDN